MKEEVLVFHLNQRDEVIDLQGVSGALLATSNMQMRTFVSKKVQLYDSHGIGAKYTGPHPVAPTMTATYGKGGNNVPLITEEEEFDPPAEDGKRKVRGLTPLECERLQGYPDGWTAIPKARDGARYKALGNSVAIPCVDYIMQGIAYFLRKELLTEG